MKIYGSVAELVGNTPLLELKRFAELNGARATILAKLEFFNPAGSVKDRVAKNINAKWAVLISYCFV